MDEQFDKNITNRVKEVFENYDDPFANEGWLKLREKFPEKRRRRPAAWWWLGTAAAVLLVFLGIGLWLNKKQVQTKKIAFKKMKIIKTEQPGSFKEHAEKNNNSNQSNNDIVKEEKMAGAAQYNGAIITRQNNAADHRKYYALAKAAQRPVSGIDVGKKVFTPTQAADTAKHPVVQIQQEQLVVNAQPK